MIQDQDASYHKFDVQCRDTVRRIAGSHRYEEEVFVPTLGEQRWQMEYWEGLRAKADELPAPDQVYSLLRGHFQEFVSTRLLGLTRAWAHPGRFLLTHARYIDFLARRDSRSPHERARLLKCRLGQTDKVWQGVLELLGRTSAGEREEAARAALTLGKIALASAVEAPILYSGVGNDLLRDIQATLRRQNARCTGWAEEARRLPEGGHSRVSDKMPHRSYEQILSEEFAVDLAQVAHWQETLLEETKEDLLRTASRADGGIRTPRDVFAYLEKNAGPASSGPEMFSRMENYIGVAKKAALDGYVDLPEEVCLVSPAPFHAKADFALGGYSEGCPRQRPLVGECFFDQTNFRAVTDGWLKMMAIAQCYPGRHVQFVRGVSDPLPATVTLGARSVPLIEGTIQRSVSLLGDIFDDPAFSVFLKLRRHHAAIRIRTDLYLHYYHRRRDDAEKLYVQELGFHPEAAKEQIKMQEENPGYTTCSGFFGEMKLRDLEKTYMPDAKEFTRTLFSVGRLGLSGFEEFLQLSPHDKKRFLTGYSGNLP